MDRDLESMGRREEARWWLRTAESNLEAARTLRTADQNHHCAFHAQQAAEKALKAVLAFHGEAHRTHACTELVGLLAGAGIDVPDGLDTAGRRLDLHYVQARYPNGLGGDPTVYYDAEIADETLELAERFLALALEELGDAA